MEKYIFDKPLLYEDIKNYIKRPLSFQTMDSKYKYIITICEYGEDKVYGRYLMPIVENGKKITEFNLRFSNNKKDEKWWMNKSLASTIKTLSEQEYKIYKALTLKEKIFGNKEYVP